MKSNQFSHLLQPMQIGRTVFKNRMLAAPPSVPTLDHWGHLTAQNIAYYEEKARGGFASVTVGEGAVYSKDGLTHGPQIRLDDPSAVPSLMELTEAIHSHNALASIELTHGGGMSKPAFNGGQDPIGPSAMVSKHGYQVAEMSEEKMYEIAEAFGKAAAFAKGCGFDMCVIHGGHGWLLGQFLSPLFNHREDQYGGSVENRMRFPLMVIDNIRRSAGPGFLIEYRFSGDEFYPGGYTIDEGVAFAKLLDGRVDLIHVSAGLHLIEPTLVKTHPSIFHQHGENVCLAAAIKPHVSTPVVTVGAMSDPDLMERYLAEGKADFISMGRQTLADPHLPKKLLMDRSDDVCPCIRCLECMGASLGFGPMELHCTVNPILGREFKEQLRRPAGEPKRVLVAGGGPGGMMAAITAARRGHTVTLCEAKDHLGGALNVAEGVPFKANLLRFRNYLIHQLEKSGAEIRLSTPVDDALVRALDPEVLIAALGAEPIVPPISGVDLDLVVGCEQAESAPLGKRVVIIGGGLIGCELAIYLNGKDHQVTIAEMLDDVAKDAKLFHRVAVMDQLRPVTIETGARCTEITPQGVWTQARDGSRKLLEADSVVIAVGMKSRLAQAEALRPLVREFIPIGDCTKPGKIMNAVRAGYDAAMDL